MKFKRIISAGLCVLSIFTSSLANASILGSETVKHARLNIGKGAVLETNVFYSDQSGVGNQSEYFVEYTPNTDLVPTVVNGDIYGKLTASSMAQSMLDSGDYPTMLINSDFFAINTGIPLSHQVVDGVLTVMDANGMDAIGFNEDGTAFISYLTMGVEVRKEDVSVSMGAVNKLRQPYAIYMFTDKFSDTTKATTQGVNVVIGSVTGKLSPGSTIEGIVESVTEDEGAVAIGKDKLVLSADINAPAEQVEMLRQFAVGDKVDITVSAEGDVRWNDAKHILGAWGGRIVRNSEIVDVDEAAAPRTAFGIKEDGTLIFYALDGRKTGHSYGARLKTLAKRMLELGCVDAVNLDGGGSTTIGAIYPGGGSFSVINKPSDGAERKVATFIGLVNTAPRTGAADKLFIYPYIGNYLSGATVQFSAFATDENYYRTDVPDGLVFTSPDGSVSHDGKLKITGDGSATVRADAGGISASIALSCYSTPTSITVKNSSGNKTVSTLTLSPGESVDLNAYAYVGNKSLIGDDSCFTWQCSDDIGTIDSSGKFTATDEKAKGTISISAGDYTKTISVDVRVKKPYIDISFEEDNNGEVAIRLDTDDAIELTDADISVKADGKEVEAALNGRKINLVFSDNKAHKITVTAVNTGGYKTVAGYTTKGNSYDNIFADIEESYWARDYIAYMNSFGVVNGIAENSKIYFKPANNITRAEFAVMIANLIGIDPLDFEKENTGFIDSGSIPAWCINHIKALNTLGIMTGKEVDTGIMFDSSATLTRAEAVAVISRLLPDNIETKESSFADKGSIPLWSADAFTKLTSLGVLKGYDDNTVKPQNNITRAEAIKMLYEVY